MKKLSFTFAALLALAFSAVSQDTIPMKGQVRDGYYYDSNYVRYKNPTLGQFGGLGNGGELGKYFKTNDTLTIYGIAIGIRDGGEFLTSQGLSLSYNIYDTSYAHAYEYLRLYEPYPDSLHWTHQVKIHLRHTPVAYYAYYSDTVPTTPRYLVNMYECYFNTPATVVDSFYAGMTFNNNTNYRDSSTGMSWDDTYIPLMIRYLHSGSAQYYDRLMWYGNTYHQWHKQKNYNYFLIFPLLLPPDSTMVGNDTIITSDTTMVGDTIIVCDTIIVGNDTIIQYDTILGIQDGSMLQRLTGVMPNPAGKTAKVVSSFGMTLVEVYNMAGEKVHTLRLPDAPLTATLDVGRWPSGAYILRIHTPQGVAIKKLAVRH